MITKVFCMWSGEPALRRQISAAAQLGLLQQGLWSRVRPPKPLRTGRASRLLKIGSVAAGLVQDAAGATLASRGKMADAFHIRAAQRLEKSLGEMRGLPMKLGQMLSHVDDMVPEAQRHIYRGVMRKLQADTTPHPWPAMRAVLESQLGAPVEEFFEYFNTEVAAAASIGQVYRATLKDGRKVAVKIQYPGIRKAIESDMRNIDSLTSAFRFALPKVDIEAMVQEVTSRLVEECDYQQEMQNQATFCRLWQKDDILFVPAPVPPLCRERVLVTEWAEGQS